MTLEQIANWNSQRNPLENVYGKETISPTITTRVAESIGGGINASTILICEDFDDIRDLRDLYRTRKMEEIKCKQVATLQDKKFGKDQNRRVYGENGLSPAIQTCAGGNREPKIAEPLVWDGFNQQVRADSSVLGTLTRNCGADLKRNGQGIIEPLALDEQNQYIRQDGIVGTLTTDGSSPKHNNRVIEPTTPDYRIRKLTPKECFRLQGVKDKDIDKIMANQSNSSGYHLAGDSICATVLVGIFAQMLQLDSETKIRKTVKQIKGDI